jgi:hypothetical protein
LNVARLVVIRFTEVCMHETGVSLSVALQKLLLFRSFVCAWARKAKLVVRRRVHLRNIKLS